MDRCSYWPCSLSLMDYGHVSETSFVADGSCLLNPETKLFMLRVNFNILVKA
jgi:hypothetical protein